MRTFFPLLLEHNYRQDLLQKWLKTKKTLTKENKTYWEKHGFDEELKRKLKWKNWEYEAYNTYMSRQKKPQQPIAGKAPRRNY